MSIDKFHPTDMKSYLPIISTLSAVCYCGYQLVRMYNTNTPHPICPYITLDTHHADHSHLEDDSSHTIWSSSHILFFKALIAALTSGLGGFPLYLLGDLPPHVMGFSIIFSAGLMSGCCVVLFIEALEVESSIYFVIFYALIGVFIIHSISYFIQEMDEFEFAGLRGQSASKSLLIVLSMAMHSLGEGISVGVSATAERDSIGLLVIISLAIHNIPEGIAVSLLLMSQGMHVWQASIFAVISNIPQPLIAIPSFIFLESFTFLLPIGYGVASGAMTYIVCTELIPEAKDKISRSLLLSTFFSSLGFVVSIALCAQN
eukprot:183934_1